MTSVVFGLNVQSAATSIPFTGTTLSALASATYVASTSSIDLRTITSTSKMPLDVIITFEATPGTVSGNKQALVFVITSVDNSVFSTGPTSGTTVTNQPNLEQIGVLPLLTNTTLQRRHFSLVKALGFLPPAFQPIVFNDSGAAFTTGVMSYSLIVGDGT